ncbi:MAG: hypothetical protein AAB799_01805 [Patescibacteria group bacterium]
MFKVFVVAAAFAVIIGGELTWLDNSKNTRSVSVNEAVTDKAQEPQPPPQEGSKHCERPDPNGDPNVGGTDPNKLGCTCMRKCENGKPTENYEEGKRCKVHCKPDNCECPNPCKT